MKFLLSYKLFEKSSLINIGVPKYVMKLIQRNYSISDDAQWGQLTYKKDITTLLRNQKNNLVISVCENKINILFSYNKEYYTENYSLKSDDFGVEQWIKSDRTITNLTDAVKEIGRSCKSYQLISGTWLHEFSKVRKIRKAEKDFDSVTNNFKKDFAENFTNIVKRLYGRKANVITDIIVSHLANVKNNLSDEKIREILFLNIDRAREIDILKKKQKAKDPYKLYNDIVRADSLTIFNEYLIRFEDEYSDKYKEYLNVPIMIEKFSRDKVMTAFMIYLYTGKLMEL
jgi:hypothetical protein